MSVDRSLIEQLSLQHEIRRIVADFEVLVLDYIVLIVRCRRYTTVNSYGRARPSYSSQPSAAE